MGREGALRVALTMPAASEATDFVRLVQPELPGAYRLAGYLLRDATEAEDATQDALEKAWQAWPKLRETDRFSAWFDRIVVNVCRQRQRRSRVMPLVLGTLPEVAVVDGAAGRAERDALRRALDRLTPEHRAVVVLRHLEGRSIADIAARTGERQGTVKSRLHYALRELRSAYDAADRASEDQP